MTGVIDYRAYLPAYRLDAQEVAGALGGTARGSRVVASFDQDTTTLGVEAALPLAPVARAAAASLWFATTAPVYAEKANAPTIHAALDLPPDIPAVDLGATPRSGLLALMSAARDGGLAVLADMRGGAVGGVDERTGGDGSAAVLFGTGDIVAEVVATGSTTAEFLDRWRAPGETTIRSWEERFGESRYLELTRRLLEQLEKQGVNPRGVARFAVVGGNARAARSATALLTSLTAASAQEAGMLGQVGDLGAARAGFALAALLDAAAPDELLVLVSLADGADALVLRTTAAIADHPTRLPVTAPDERVVVSYPQFLVWRGRVEAETPRRPEPERPSAPYAWRNRQFKHALHGGRCDHCGAVQLPVPAVCYRCRHSGPFTPVDASGQTARIVTATVDRLAFSPNPPLMSAVVQFEGGGRIQCELTDVRKPPAVGDLVRPTFRRGATLNGIHNYAWKARPVAAPAPGEEASDGPAQPE